MHKPFFFLGDTVLEESLFFAHVAFHDDKQNVPAVVTMNKLLKSSCPPKDLSNMKIFPVAYFISKDQWQVLPF